MCKLGSSKCLFLQFQTHNVLISHLIFILILPFLLLGCDLSDIENSTTEFEFNFRESAHNWNAFFTDYNVEMEEDMNLVYEYGNLPEPLDTDEKGHFLSAINRSDDVKMLMRREVDGLEPSTTYQVEFTVRFATSVPSGCAGIGGAPGEAVRVVADASEIKPEAFIEDEYYRLNIQQQEETDDWYQNAILGNIANSRDCEDDPVFEIKELNSELNHDLVVTDENGRVWLLLGTRSGFEGQTDLYYTYFRADFREL